MLGLVFFPLQTELSPVITDLAPAGNTGQIPFLAVADDLGSRTPVLQATSALSGGLCSQRYHPSSLCKSWALQILLLKM